ncbi:MAG: ABC transporter permease [Pandoraea sp.]|nr:ABC transporter permease [Pandoraea sp.]MDR3399293.1 ABC transporter permease [Pandoraea sp.]
MGARTGARIEVKKLRVSSRDFSHCPAAVRYFSIAVAVLMLAPVAVVVLYAFSADSYFSLPPTRFSWRWFESFWSNEGFRSALNNSLLISFVVSPITLIIALPAAYALSRGTFAGRQALTALLMSPIIVPGVVTGVAFLALSYKTHIGPGFVAIVVSMICITLPYALRALLANMHGLRLDLEESARNLGATHWQVFRMIVLPQLRPGLLAGGIFIFVETIDNFTIASFLVTPTTTTLPVEAYYYLRDFDDPTVAAMSCVVFLISTLLVLALDRLIGLEKAFTTA